MELGLTRIKRVADRLALNPDNALVVTVAGTNGKGSCVALLSRCLGESGAKIGAFTSPHFLHFNERICIDASPVSGELICWAFEQIEQARSEISLTYFEFATLAALLIFQRECCDAWILEIGLGGRLDASNIIDADFALISSIDLDHQDWLGDTRELIGREKAGIFKSKSVAICGDPNTPQSIIDVANEVGCPLYVRERDFFVVEQTDKTHAENVTDCELLWRGSNHKGVEQELGLPQSPAIYKDNVASVMQLIALLPQKWHLPESLFQACVAETTIKGRFQREVVDQREVILDVAHNPAAAKVLAGRLAKLPKVGRVVALFGVMADKDIDGIIEATKSYIDAWFLADLAGAGNRAKKANLLAEQIHNHGIHMISVSKNFKQAYRRAMSLMGEGDRLVVFGSFYTVAELGAIIERDKVKALRRENSDSE